ncbi:hypothetical protein GCM10023174_20740 [Chelativorans composti]
MLTPATRVSYVNAAQSYHWRNYFNLDAWDPAPARDPGWRPMIQMVATGNFAC